MVINGISPQKLAFWNAWGKIGFGEEICLFFCLGGTETALCEISMFHSLWFKEVRFSLRRWSRNYLWLRCRFGRLLMCGFTVDGTTKDVSVIVCWVVRCSTCLTATSHTTRERRVAVKWVKRRIDKWDQVTMLSLLNEPIQATVSCCSILINLWRVRHCLILMISSAFNMIGNEWSLLQHACYLNNKALNE